MATKSKTYQGTVDTADTRRGEKSALVPMAARKATSADTVNTVDTKQENLPERSEEGGFATKARLGWLCETPLGGSRTMALQKVALQGGSGAMAVTRKPPLPFNPHAKVAGH
ncbi:hypothetical protein JHK82_039434 [Glycine max]|nr:hypothetical protein JHK87_039411 [Glycine soja]KAG5110211.1 hypothetical protein JHK82_039434 [Glycine max]KAG5121500.1 hypothetical protein JHK84_039840 [Glycine max]